MTESIIIYCKNSDRGVRVLAGSSLSLVYALAGKPLRERPLGARVNGRMRSLDFCCWEPYDVEFVGYSHAAGYRTYCRSLCYVLSKSSLEIKPGVVLKIEHAISKGYYCTFSDDVPVTASEVSLIKCRMGEIISADRPFELRRVRTVEAIELFRSRGMLDKALLMETAGLTYTSYYEMDGYIDYFYGCLTPSSGYLTLFDLVPYEGGMLLRVPDRYSPTLLPELFPQEKMFRAYKESLRFQRTLGVSYVGELNRAVESGVARELILVSEALQEKQIAGIAEKIASKYAAGVRVILIAGPSSSGKTTFARRLGVQLLTNMLHPVSISLDDYYVDRSRTPLNEDGEPDYESLESIDLDLFKENLRSLISGMEVETPVYNFAVGSRELVGRRLCLRDNSVILIEGIHGLNPALTSLLPIESIYRVYVSALTSISLDAHNWIPSSDNRLLRRIIRDHHMRGYSASETILMWDRIRAGEDRWIFPYAENADTTFNSAMIYEFGVMRSYAEPLLYGISELDAGYSESYRLLRFLRYFRRISLGDIPGTSLLREFLGGSNL